MRNRLHLLGWSRQEIDHTEGILRHADKGKHPHMKKLEDSLYWFTLIIGALGTLIISILLVPVYVVGTGIWPYAMTGILAFLLGLLIVMIVKSLPWMQQHHHLFMSLLIPIVALFNFFLIVTKVNIFNKLAGIAVVQDPLLVGLTYFISFIIPYAAFMLFRRIGYGS